MNNNINLEKRFFSELTEDARSIREKVFVEEQGWQDEFDDIDSVSIHVVVYHNGVPVGTGRLFRKDQNPSSDVYIIGRVAVLAEYRKLHLGNKIMEFLEEKAKELGAVKLELSAQCRARGFYDKNGYVAVGDEYLDGDCPHILMAKIL